MQLDIRGIPALQAKIQGVEQEVKASVDAAVEKRALKMVNDTRASAPVESGKLRNSIDIITQETKPMSRTYGTNVEYARRQEYENKAKKGFFRNNVHKHEALFLNDVKNAVKKVTG